MISSSFKAVLIAVFDETAAMLISLARLTVTSCESIVSLSRVSKGSSLCGRLYDVKTD